MDKKIYIGIVIVIVAARVKSGIITAILVLVVRIPIGISSALIGSVIIRISVVSIIFISSGMTSASVF